MSVLLFDTFNGCFSPIKEINRLIWNGMECQTFTIEENFEEHKGTRHIWGNVYFGIIVFSCLY